VRDASQIEKEPSDECKSFYCKPLENYECQALVLVPDNSAQTTSSSNRPKGKIKDMVTIFENGEFDPITKTKRENNRSYFKEKGIVIKVKKNQVEEVVEKKDEQKNENEEKQNNDNTTTIAQNGDANAKETKNGTDNKAKITYDDYENDDDSMYIEPLL
jgi:hypothetical protein